MNTSTWPSFADVTDYLIVIGAAVFVALACLFLFRSRLMLRHKHHHHHRHSRSKRNLNPTLAQTGGLPPLREEKKSDGPTPPP
ncbi:MAG: hypothetical protein ACREDS_10440 [Limisphaerales bacterium]